MWRVPARRRRRSLHRRPCERRPTLRGRARPGRGGDRLAARPRVGPCEQGARSGPHGAVGRVRAARAAGHAPGLRRLQRRHGGAARLVGRHTRRDRRRLALANPRVQRGGRTGARDIRRARVARPRKRGDLRAQRAPGAHRARLLPDRFTAGRAGLARRRLRRPRPRRLRGLRGCLRRGLDAGGRWARAGRPARAR